MHVYDYFLRNWLNRATILGAAAYAVIVIIVAWVVGKLLGFAVRHYLNRANAAGVDYTSLGFIAQVVKVVVYIVAVLVYVYMIPTLQSLSNTWLASVGIISLVIGLAMQSTLSNVVAGFALIIYRPFRVGDRLQVTTPAGPEIGQVESIDLGYTRLAMSDGRRIVLPNSVITNQTSINFSRSFARVLTEIPVTVANGSNVEAALKILRDAAKTIKRVTKVNGSFISSIGAQGAALMVSVMCIDPGDVAGIKSELFEKVKKEFDEQEIKLA